AKTKVAGPPSLTPNRTAFPKPAASMTASISAARSSSVRTRETGSDSPRLRRLATVARRRRGDIGRGTARTPRLGRSRPRFRRRRLVDRQRGNGGLDLVAIGYRITGCDGVGGVSRGR